MSELFASKIRPLPFVPLSIFTFFPKLSCEDRNIVQEYYDGVSSGLVLHSLQAADRRQDNQILKEKKN